MNNNENKNNTVNHSDNHNDIDVIKIMIRAIVIKIVIVVAMIIVIILIVIISKAIIIIMMTMLRRRTNNGSRVGHSLHSCEVQRLGFQPLNLRASSMGAHQKNVRPLINRVRWGYIGIYRGYIGILEKKIETTIVYYVKANKAQASGSNLEGSYAKERLKRVWFSLCVQESPQDHTLYTPLIPIVSISIIPIYNPNIYSILMRVLGPALSSKPAKSSHEFIIGEPGTIAKIMFLLFLRIVRSKK